MREGDLEKFLPKIFELLDKGYSKAKIAKTLNISNQKMQYWFGKLEKLGFIKRTLRTSTIIYERQQKTLLNGSKKSFKAYEKGVSGERKFRVHYFWFKFPIIERAKLPFTKSWRIKNNVVFVWVARGGWVAKWFEKGNFVFYKCKPAYYSAGEAVLKCGLEADRWAGWVEASFGLRLGEPVGQDKLVHFGFESKKLGTTPVVEKTTFVGKRIGVDNSLGSPKGEIDVFGLGNALEFEALPDKVKEIEASINAFSKLAGEQERFAFAVQESLKAVNSKLDLLIEEVKGVVRNGSKRE